MDLPLIADEITIEAKKLGWKRSETRLASTGSVYIELIRGECVKEWVVIRIADHKQFYHHWLTTYSMSPVEFTFDEILEILGKPFGEVGDIL